ncbi:MAG: UDP-N-acetylmuramoyl-L-alanyl-D-glutamate--2,6-diaminopimelate ligase [Puniceicoccales bacterium]|jgi:UDP-N-acetylmuramoyl-L-alanyl-D-glutamate--2,6-diaminopimelate ligase|nr:UDP-N-acetylmuramoyl-L-alanyl-D-glutamate--2,6-diaminopimelate ligase [Puniceicoccales bacterium]
MAEYGGDILGEIAGEASFRQITCDSRKINAGDIFFAIPGKTRRGCFFTREALERGCWGIVEQADEAEEFRHKFGENGQNFRLWVVDNVRQQFVLALKKSLNISKNPIFAVTGTNGKTTITHLLRHLMDIPTAVMGTIGYDLIGKTFPAPQTTPNLEELYRMIAALPRHAALAMELSSHALDQGRAYGLALEAAIFSNLAGDHLDYHGSQKCYFLAKRKLFSGENGEKSVRNILNLNDAHGRRLHREFGGVTYGVNCKKADYNADNLQIFETKTTFQLHHRGEQYFCEVPLLGIFNVENVLAATAAIHESRGIPLGDLVKKLKYFPGVSGRLQRVPNGRGLTILIDYAHTEDGLGKVLETLEGIKRRKIITVFGCGGDRDRTKRPKMMAAACRFSDLIIATSDNPRHEAVEAIFGDMRPGIMSGRRALFEPDRKKAMELALSEAQRGDIILLAGKGHETYQQIGDDKIPFDERETVEAILAHLK